MGVIILIEMILITIKCEASVNTPNKTKDSKLLQQDACETFRCFNSADLFAGHKQIYIKHESHEYILRLTNLGKLILTK